MNIDEVQSKLSSLIPNVLSDEMVTRWICIVETIDSEGKRGLLTMCEPSMKSWDSIGMMEFALNQELCASLENHNE